MALMLEVKRPGGKGATDLQRQELQRWHGSGATCAVVRSIDAVRVILDAMDACRGSQAAIDTAARIDVGDSWDVRAG